MDSGPEAWLSKLNQALWELGMDTNTAISMDIFNATLAEVKALQKAYFMVLNKAGDRRFHKAACDPPDTWQKGCFCPLEPSTPKDRVNMIKPEGTDPAPVAWAHHLAAMLRLMPLGEYRKAYMFKRSLMDPDKAFAVFLSGPPRGLTTAAFQEIMGSLEPPVIVARSQQLGVGGKDGRAQLAYYRVDLDISHKGVARRSIVQMTMAFHQRMVDWPGQPAHCKCIPWVVGRICNLSMIHHPLLVVELALAAWGMKVEETMLDLQLNAKDILECNLGLLEKSGHKVFKQRTAAAAASLNDSLGACMVAPWVQSSAPDDEIETDLWGTPILSKRGHEELQASEMGTERHCWQTGPGQWLNSQPGAGDMHRASHDESQTGPDQWDYEQPWAGKGNMGPANHGWQTGPEQHGNEQSWAGHEYGHEHWRPWPSWNTSDGEGRAEQNFQPQPWEPDTEACENTEAAAFASPDMPLSNAQRAAQQKLFEARARMRGRGP